GGDGGPVALAVRGPDEAEPQQDRHRQQDEDVDRVAGEREEDRQGRDEQAERDRHEPEAQLRAADELVLLGRDLPRVPAPAAALALPGLAVAQVALLAAFAVDGDRRPAQDRARRLVAAYVHGYGPCEAVSVAPCAKRLRRKASSSGSPPSRMSSATSRPMASVLKPCPESTI